MGDPVAQARQWYAEELRFTAHVRSWAVVDAFATVPRELFVGPGPWRILSQWDLGVYWTTADADPRHVYHDVLIALDEKRRLNNGQPCLWAFLYDQIGLDRSGSIPSPRMGAYSFRSPMRVRWLTPRKIFACVGGRDPGAEARLAAAMERSRLSHIKSLRLAPEEPDATCWLAGDGWWLSTADAM
jgi:hypothetical protein